MDAIERVKDRRQGEGQRGSDRRSGVDNRTPEERLRHGERRVQSDRRSGVDRRRQVASPSRGYVWKSFAVVLIVFCAIDLHFFNGDHSLQLCVQAANSANTAIEGWIGRGFRP